MKKVKYLGLVLSMPFLLGACSSSSSKSDAQTPTCTDTQKLVNNTCVEKTCEDDGYNCQSNAPTIDTSFSNLVLQENSGTTNYEINVSDADGDNLTLSVESNDTSIIAVTPNYTNPINQSTYTNALDFNLTTQSDVTGSAKITITVDDGEANSTTSFEVNILKKFESGDMWKELTYNTVVSPHTGKVWLDRNLGSSKLCNNYNDTNCLGDYYQWGRDADGHEKSDSNATAILADSVTPNDGSFIKPSVSPYDWVDVGVDDDGAQRSANWSKTDGSSVCPVGYRVPTMDELAAETIDADVTNNITAFNSFLKLPSTGYRHNTSGELLVSGSIGIVWSSSVGDNHQSRYLSFHFNGADRLLYYRANGYSVRCLQDNTPPTANAGQDQNVTAGASVDLDASASSDSDGTIVSYEWKIGETVLSTAASFSKSDFAIGTHTLTLKVTDDGGAVGTDTVVVTVNAIIHNGTSYGVVTSPYTSKVWLDRNLGASRVCTTYFDTDCYGDYYQWGRNADGHQESNSTTSSTRATDINNAGTNFITFNLEPYDWTGVDVNGYQIDSNGSQRVINWSKTDGSSICPVGYRVPTETELANETTEASTAVNNNIDAFNNFLKLPSAGVRDRSSGSMSYQGSYGGVWSSSVNNFGSMYLGFGSGSASTNYNDRAYGSPVRCLRD
jgi:hypothetical protein